MTTITKSPVNDTKLSKLAYVACCIKKYKSINFNNTPLNTDVGEKHDGQIFMKLSEYMNKLCTETYKFHGSI